LRLGEYILGKKNRICKVRDVGCDPKFAKLKELLDVCAKLMKTN
jgi:hypothetical protein